MTTTTTHSRYAFTVTDAAGNRRDNLVGVFARAFPIATLAAIRGQISSVTYYGQRYTVAPVA